MRVLVTGSRSPPDSAPEFITRVLDGLDPRPTCIIHGCATGVDACAAFWAKAAGIAVDAYPVTAYEWKRHGKWAGPLRNMRMLKESAPDFVLAFPGGKGTENMKRIARSHGVKVYEVQP
jgi:hypothetical protein